MKREKEADVRNGTLESSTSLDTGNFLSFRMKVACHLTAAPPILPFMKPLLAPLFSLLLTANHAWTANAPRPNIIVILADDAGFADFGCYGGVADTPQIDRLAAEGMRFTRAYTNARCMPTRLSLLTGLPPQLADTSLYSEIKPTGVTLAEVLREAGYATYMVGKWHIGTGNSTVNPKPIPSARGFDRFYGIWEGAAHPRKSSLIDPARGNGTVRIIEDGQPLPWDQVPDDYYVTFTWTQKAIQMIESTPAEKPFFLYLAHTAPHWPIDPNPEYVAPYAGRFHEGWDVLRDRILTRQKQLGIFPESQNLSPRFDFVQPFATAPSSVKTNFTSNTEKYYASLTEMDKSIGDLMAALQATGRADNTLVIFLSDNGADDIIGGNARGMVSNAPFSGFKLTYFEGGIATPFVAWWPGRIPANTINTHHEVRLEDFMPTILELAGATYPTTYNGAKIFPHHGRSFLPALLNPSHDGGPRFWHWEHDAQRGVWNAPWKAVFVDYRHPAISDDPTNPSDSAYFTPDRNGWHLYNLANDRSESLNLASTEPDRLASMIQSWKNWATSVGWTPTGRWSEDNPLDEGFRGSPTRAKPETYQRFFPLPGDQSSRGLIQVFGLDSPARGLRRLAFQAVNPTGGPMRVSVYGANAMPTIPPDAADNPASMPDHTTIPSLGTPVATFDFGGTIFDWSSFTTAVDFGTGSGFSHVTLVFQLPDSGQSVDATQLAAATYSDWAALHFSPSDLANPAIAGPQATAPAGDAPNAIKYLAGLPPTQPGGLAQSVNLTGNEIEIAMNILPGVLDRASFLWEQSGNLTTWTPATPRFYGLAPGGAPGLERAVFRLPLAAAVRSFFRARPILSDGGAVNTGARMGIINGTFDTGFLAGSGWALGSTHAGQGWVANSSGSRWSHSGTDAFVGSTSGASNLAQILVDNNATQGQITLRFEAVNSGGDTLAIYLYGSNDLFNLNLYDTGGPKIGSTIIPHTVLINGQNFNQATSTPTPREVTFTIPPGGFKYYGLLLRTAGVTSSENQRIDNLRFE